MPDSPSSLTRLVTDESPTKELLREILTVTRKSGVEYKFVCARGASGPILDRIRMMLSRTRKKMERERIPFKQFRLMSRIIPLVNTSKELVVVWQSQSGTNQLDELILRALATPVPSTLRESK
jgi:hypothetical protein